MASSSKIQLYSLATPNGMKVSIALEEMELEYDAHTVNIMKGEQFKPEFLAVNPNGKIPAIVDPEGPDGKPMSLFESGAILLYLAEKTGKFLSHHPRLKWETIQWVFFQMANVGPYFGQFGHFFKYGKDKCKDPYPLERYSNETKRLLGVLEQRLQGREYLIDEGYSIADIATYPWVYCLVKYYEGSEYLGLDNYPSVMAWKARCMARPAAAKGMTVMYADGKPMNIFESGAILQYLAEKTGKFLSQHPQVKLETIQWLFFQMADVAPMLVQFGHFFKIAKNKCMDPYLLEHYTNEARHVLHLLDQCLEGRDYLIHEGYTIADMAILPRVYALEEVFKASQYLGLHNFPNVTAWKACCIEQPPTAKGLTTGKRL